MWGKYPILGRFDSVELSLPTTASTPLGAEQAALTADGVVMLRGNNWIGAGTLLYDGSAVLTAAHVINGAAGVSDINVVFDTEAGRVSFDAADAAIHPDYEGLLEGPDLGLVWLDDDAPTSAERYSLYREADGVGAVTELIGYGRSGTGADGSDVEFIGTRRAVENTIDADASALDFLLSDNVAPNERWAIDFDNGNPANDALGQLIGATGLGLGAREGLVARGDSGGPALLNNEIAAVNNAIASLSNGEVAPDIDSELNASFGEIATLQRVAGNTQWIDQKVRDAYSDAPTTPEEVDLTVQESDEGISYAYFLVEFIGMRDEPDQILSVNYRTEDGSAVAGEDYLPVEGELALYPDEDQAVIPVEIIGDTEPEKDEIFSLVIFEPVGGSFGVGVTELAATRTILDDDG